MDLEFLSGKFSIFFNYGGYFVKLENVVDYLGGSFKRVHGLDVDRFGFFDLKEEVEKLGVGKFERIVYRVPDVTGKQIFKDVVDDSVVMEMIRDSTQKRSLVEVYVVGENQTSKKKAGEAENGVELGVEAHKEKDKNNAGEAHELGVEAHKEKEKNNAGEAQELGVEAHKEKEKNNAGEAQKGKNNASVENASMSEDAFDIDTYIEDFSLPDEQNGVDLGVERQINCDADEEGIELSP
ncbi:myb domain protein 4r1 [Striga asiatica]|uniref:Myb domain protein 4r1 n=1 Tax=Striga asiatica TaxID=4170 RepID=A0A5A7QMT8_STRAF|nr:myb domain protein 4r1 [Striga asiatica]